MAGSQHVVAAIRRFNFAPKGLMSGAETPPETPEWVSTVAYFMVGTQASEALAGKTTPLSSHSPFIMVPLEINMLLVSVARGLSWGQECIFVVTSPPTRSAPASLPFKP